MAWNKEGNSVPGRASGAQTIGHFCVHLSAMFAQARIYMQKWEALSLVTWPVLRIAEVYSG